MYATEIAVVNTANLGSTLLATNDTYRAAAGVAMYTVFLLALYVPRCADLFNLVARINTVRFCLEVACITLWTLHVETRSSTWFAG